MKSLLAILLFFIFIGTSCSISRTLPNQRSKKKVEFRYFEFPDSRPLHGSYIIYYQENGVTHIRYIEY